MKTPTTLVIAALTASAITVWADDLKLENCPPAVQETIRANARDGKVDDVDTVTIEGKTLYVAEVNLANGKDLDVHVGSDGKLIKTTEDIQLSETPAAVQEAVKKLEAEGGRLDDIDKNVANGKITYEVDIDRSNAPDLDIVLDESGSVISRKENP